MMGWFDGKTDCYSCGKEIEKKSAEKRFGKYFCSKKEADIFADNTEEQRKAAPPEKRGGCC